MAWINQNWWGILLVVGLIYLMNRTGMGCGHSGRGHQHNRHDGDMSQSPSGANIDPVTGEAVEMNTAAATVYQGKTYYFSSRENRDRFEAAPAQYVAKIHDSHEESHKHGGCC